MKHKEIRKTFLEYFSKKNHTVLNSFSIIPPKEDSTLLFTNAGMVPLKSWFLNESQEEGRFTSIQKCIRAGGKHNDLENVGKTPRHHTFFEMMGNFAVGGAYFKQEAIQLAWEFLTKTLNLPPSMFYISIFQEDEE